LGIGLRRFDYRENLESAAITTTTTERERGQNIMKKKTEKVIKEAEALVRHVLKDSFQQEVRKNYQSRCS
jgi:fructose-specific phosphotransferase system component IIB